MFTDLPTDPPQDDEACIRVHNPLADLKPAWLQISCRHFSFRKGLFQWRKQWKIIDPSCPLPRTSPDL